VKEFVLRARVQAAAELLRSTGRPIAEIALDCGFYDQSAFTRQFRKRTGVTPERWRRRSARELTDWPQRHRDTEQTF